MKTIIIYCTFFLLAPYMVLGQTVYTITGGTFANPASSSTAEANGIPIDEIVWVEGDELVIPAGVTFELQGNFIISEIVKVKNQGTLYFNGGKIDLPEGSVLGMGDGSKLCCAADCVADCNDNNEKIKIGSTQYKGSDLEDIDNGPRPVGVTSSTVLPITLGRFYVIPNAKGVQLEWETISEENFDFFSIERSEDGENFYEIGTLPGNGNSTERIQYSYVDNNPVFGTSFYRLNAIDYDGTYEKFQSISIEFIPNELHVSLYPNPGNGKDMRIQLGLPVEAKLKTVSIYNFSGDLILSKELKVGNNNLSFERQLPKGLYFAKIQIDNYFLSKKLVIN